MATVLLTGAAGFIGRAVHRQLRRNCVSCVAIDKSCGPCADDQDCAGDHIIACDLTDAASLDALLALHEFECIIHLAAILPGAASKDPVRATRINIGGSLALLERAVTHRVRRLVFGSSTSVYGAAGTETPIAEQTTAAPIDVYGAAKRTVEIIGENLKNNGDIEFVSLRIATAVGSGARNTSSPWRSEIFEKLGSEAIVSLPYAANDLLTVVHVDDLARMLILLAQAKSIQHTVYNTPAELLTASELERTIESIASGTRIELTGRTRPLAPLADGSRFASEFGFQAAPLRQHLQAALRQGVKQI